jgi:hypothetical protein
MPVHRKNVCSLKFVINFSLFFVSILTLNILCITYFYAGTGHPDAQAVVGVHQKKVAFRLQYCNPKSLQLCLAKKKGIHFHINLTFLVYHVIHALATYNVLLSI